MLKKYASGKVLEEDKPTDPRDHPEHTASTSWSAKDEQELASENRDA
jgi:hypothetical protein